MAFSSGTRRSRALIRANTKEIDSIVEQTAKIVGLPSIVVLDIVDHCFDFLKRGIQNPFERPYVLLHEFGRFSINHNALTHDLRTLIVNYRKVKIEGNQGRMHGETMRKKIKKLGSWRQLSLKAVQWRKDNNSRFVFSKPE